MAIAFDVGGKSTVQASVANYSFTGPTLGALTNGVVWVAIQTRGASSDGDLAITGITYNGVAMTVGKAQLASDIGGPAGSLKAEIWYLVNPPSGAKTVAITFTGTINHSTAYVGALSGVDQSTPVDATAGSGDANDSSPTSTVTQNITTVADQAWIVDSIYHKIGTALTKGSGQTLVATESFPNGGGDTSDASYKGPVSAGANSTSWSLTGDDGWVMASVSFKPYVAAANTRRYSLTLTGLG